MMQLSQLLGYALSFVIGYIASYLVVQQTKKEKNVKFEIVTRAIIFENFSNGELELHYEKENVPNLYMLVVRLWNRGREHVLGRDISPNGIPTVSIDERSRFLGKPRVKQSNEAIGAKSSLLEDQKCIVSFDCLNHDEWIEMVFFYSGHPHSKVTTSARIYGQNSPAASNGERENVGFLNRVLYLMVLLLIVLSPICFVILLFTLPFLYLFSMLDLLFTSEGETHLWFDFMLILGTFVPSLWLFNKIKVFFKRRKNPKGYVIEEDTRPAFWEGLKPAWKMVLTGKAYYPSNSIYSFGESDDTNDTESWLNKDAPD